MPHKCNAGCRRLVDLLLQGSPNGVWENILTAYDSNLGKVAERCWRVEVRPVGNKKLLVLRDRDSSVAFVTNFSASSAAVIDSHSCRNSAVATPLSPPLTPSKAQPLRSFNHRRLCRVDVSWVKSVNHFDVNDTDRVPNHLRQIEETLRLLKGAQKPMLDSEFIIGAYGIVRSQDVGPDFGLEGGWTRVEIKRVDSDGILLSCIDYGNEMKLPQRSVCVMPRFVADYPPQSISCRLKNPANERLLWSPVHSKYFSMLMRQCDYVLYTLRPFREICGETKSPVKIVEFYVELSDGVFKSAAETVLFLEEMNNSSLQLSASSDPVAAKYVQDDDEVEPISKSLESSLVLSPPHPLPPLPRPLPPLPRPPRFLDNLAISPAYAADASTSPDQEDQLMSTCVGADQLAPLPPPMALPPPNAWVPVYIPNEFRRLCGIRPNYIIVCPSPIKTQFDASMRGFAEAMEEAAPMRADDVVKGGCYAAQVPGIDSGDANSRDPASKATWARVVAAESTEGRCRVFCGDLGVWAVEPVRHKDMRLLPANYLEMPFQAIVADLNVDPVDEEGVKKPDGITKPPARYSPEAFKLLQDKLRGASLLQAHVKEVEIKPLSWPRVKMTLFSLMREDKPDCLVRLLTKKKLATSRDSS